MVFRLKNENVQATTPSGLKAIDMGLIGGQEKVASSGGFFDAGAAFEGSYGNDDDLITGDLPSKQPKDPDKALEKIVNEDAVLEEEQLVNKIMSDQAKWEEAHPQKEIAIEDIDDLGIEEEVDLTKFNTGTGGGSMTSP